MTDPYFELLVSGKGTEGDVGDFVFGLRGMYDKEKNEIVMRHIDVGVIEIDFAGDKTVIWRKASVSIPGHSARLIRNF